MHIQQQLRYLLICKHPVRQVSLKACEIDSVSWRAREEDKLQIYSIFLVEKNQFSQYLLAEIRIILYRYIPLASHPSNHTTLQPTNHPTIQPSNHPTIQPSNHPNIQPSKFQVPFFSLSPFYCIKIKQKFSNIYIGLL